MAIEQQYYGYYDDVRNGKSYVDARYYTKLNVSYYLAKTFFSSDVNRVLYSQPEYAFRKRLELLAKGFQEEDLGANFKLDNLELPFCSFYFDKSPVLCKTAATSELVGIYNQEFGQWHRWYGMKYHCKVVLFFHRYDDACVALDMALAEQNTETPFVFADEAYWRHKSIYLPVLITFKDAHLGEGKSAQDEKFLKETRLFTVVFDLDVETTQTLINRGKENQQLPFRFQAIGPDTWKDGDTTYYTQRSELAFMNNSDRFDMGNLLSDSKHETKELATLEPADEETARTVQELLPSKAIHEVVKGVFNEHTSVDFNMLKYVSSTTNDEGECTAKFALAIKPSSFQYFKEVLFIIPSLGDPIHIRDCHQSSLEVSGLRPNSIYKAIVVTKSITGDFKTVYLDFQTSKWNEELLPEMNGEPQTITTTQNLEEEVVKVPKIKKGKVEPEILRVGAMDDMSF